MIFSNVLVFSIELSGVSYRNLFESLQSILLHEFVFLRRFLVPFLMGNVRNQVHVSFVISISNSDTENGSSPYQSFDRFSEDFFFFVHQLWTLTKSLEELRGQESKTSASKERITLLNSHRREYFSKSVDISHDP
jgi:hypothetical protein